MHFNPSAVKRKRDASPLPEATDAYRPHELPTMLLQLPDPGDLPADHRLGRGGGGGGGGKGGGLEYHDGCPSSDG